MSAEAKAPTFSGKAGEGEPRSSRDSLPIWLVILFALLLYWGMVYFDQNSGWFSTEVYQPMQTMARLEEFQPPVGDLDPRGKIVYDSVCALCHDPSGSGHPGQAPPFIGSEWVMGSPNRLIRIPLAGLGGPITVHGQSYTFGSAMPAMGAALPDSDLAAVLSYMRRSWGNQGSIITAEQVKAIRAAVGNRSQPFTPEEIQQVPEK